jgi:hypothetical protein
VITTRAEEHLNTIMKNNIITTNEEHYKKLMKNNIIAIVYNLNLTTHNYKALS